MACKGHDADSERSATRRAEASVAAKECALYKQAHALAGEFTSVLASWKVEDPKSEKVWSLASKNAIRECRKLMAYIEKLHGCDTYIVKGHVKEWSRYE